MSKRNLDNGDEIRSKRGKGGGKSGSKAEKGGNKGGDRNIKGLGQPRRYAFKVLCSNSLAANLIGKEGKTRLQIEEESGAAVWISKREDVFPDPQYRLLILHADRPDQVLVALEMVVPRLLEVASRDRDNGRFDLIGKDEGEYVFHCALPSMIRGVIIGKGGERIEELQRRTGAKLSIDPEVYSGHQAARVIGTESRIVQVLRTLNDQVQGAADSQEFAEWISCLPQGAPQGRRRSPPRRDRSPRRRENRNQRRGRPAVEEGRPDEDRPLDEFYEERRREDFHDEGYQDSSGAGWHSAEEDPRDVLDELARELDTFPPGAIQLNHQINFQLPVEEIPREDFRKYVEEKTRTEVVFAFDNDQAATEVPCTITGHLLDINLAHVMIMRNLHEARAEVEREKAERLRREEEEAAQAQAQETKAAEVEALKAQVAAMQRQLDMIQRR